MKQTQNDYTIVKGNGEDKELEKYRLCFERNGTPRDMQNLEWLHRQNLPGRNMIYYAMHNEMIASIYTALPVILRINGLLKPGLQSIDTLTDMEYRGKGLFIKLATRLYEDAVNDKYEFIYGFPNDNSAPGFFKKLQWKSFGEAPFLFKPLNPLYFLKKIFTRKKSTDFSSTNYVFDVSTIKHIDKDISIRPITIFDNAYNEIWKHAAENIGVCVDRSAEYMNWRYINKPGENYYRFGIYMQEKLSGIVVFSIKNKHDGLIGYLMELIFDPSITGIGKQLLKFTTGLFKKHKVDVVLAWNIPGTFNHNAYKQSGYYHLPEKIRPQKLFLGAKLFNQSMEPIMGNIKKWYISYSDSDTA